MKKEKERLLGRQVWCQTCLTKVPSRIKRAAFLIPTRKNPYDLCPADIGIDRRVYGICDECLNGKGKFQKANTEAVDINHEHLVIYKAG